MYKYKAHITNIVDGDTFDADVDLGFGITASHRFRLNGIDTPEVWRPKTKAEKEHGMEAAKYLRGLILGEDVILTSHKLGIYGRYDADVYIEIQQTEVSIVRLLINNGFEKRDDYED